MAIPWKKSPLPGTYHEDLAKFLLKFPGCKRICKVRDLYQLMCQHIYIYIQCIVSGLEADPAWAILKGEAKEVVNATPFLVF